METITGFENLYSLTHLTFSDNSALKRLPDFGGLKALTYVNIHSSDLDEIPGLDKLPSLTTLRLRLCKALKRLPYLGNLKALSRLDTCFSGVDEIPGVRELVNLKYLDCRGSEQEWLPDLSLLPRLRRVHLADTPLVRAPSSKYFGKPIVKFRSRVKWTEEVADVSDPDYVPSDEAVFCEGNGRRCESSSDVEYCMSE